MNTQKDYPNRTKIIAAIILFFILFSFAPTFYEWHARFRVHDERHFELVHNFPTDYNLYLSRIRQGKEGAWLATEKYTSEPHEASLSQVLYVIIGRLSHFSHVQTPYVWFAYHVARAFFAAFLLVIIWNVIRWAMSTAQFSWQVITYLLIVTASTWPKFEWVAGYPRFGGYMPWYTMADSLQRTTFMPHVTLAQGLLAFIIFVFSGGFISKQLPGNWIFLGVVGIILGIVFPPGLLFIYGVLGLVTIGEMIHGVWALRKEKQKKRMFWVSWIRESVFSRGIFGIMTLPTVVYYWLLLQQYPWKRLVEFDVLHPTKFSFVEYFLAVGPVLPLGLLGIVYLVLKKESGRFRYFIAWVAAWLAFVFIFNWIPQQSPTRFTQMVPHIPLGILAGAAILSIGKKMRAVTAVPVVVIVFGLGTMASSYLWLKDFVDHKIRATLPIVPSGAQVMYPMGEIIEGLIWLQVFTPRDAIVLSGMTTGNYIPVYAGNTSYVGHANTVRLEEKLMAAGNFYRRQLPPEEEMAWIKSQNISYVFYGFEEREINGGAPDLRSLYPTLDQVYESANVRIYRVPR